jgi:hypothetical protein
LYLPIAVCGSITQRLTDDLDFTALHAKIRVFQIFHGRTEPWVKP